jgi:hypothetical protein
VNLRSTSITISGSSFSWHDVESYFRPNAVGAFSFTPNNRIAFNKVDPLFDATVMMDCSQCPLHPDLKSDFHSYAAKNADIARRHGSVPVLFMSWAYADAPSMTRELADAYTLAGNTTKTLVIPAGLAFAKSIARKPELNLYAPDKRHPSLAGTYLATATTYAALYGKSPEGLGYTAGLDEATARHLQTVAWDTVQEYYGH